MGCGHHARVREEAGMTGIDRERGDDITTVKTKEAGMTGIDRERGDDITTVKTIEDVRAMKRAHKGGTWKYACACRSGVRYEGEPG